MSHPLLAGLALAVLAAAAVAQPAPASAPPAASASVDPTDPRAPVPAPVYRSVLAGLPSGAEPPAAVPWRAANDQVGRIGGWKAYAREAAVPAPAASAPHAPQPAATPPAHPHGGHR